MNRSIKRNLIRKLFILIVAALAVTYLVSFYSAKKEIDEVFDADMIKSSKIIFGALGHGNFIEDREDLDEELRHKFFNRYEYKIHAQAWLGDKMIYNSGEDLDVKIPQKEGFSNVKINNKKWRSFSFLDEKSQIKILVLEKYSVRQELILEIMLSLLIPFLISLFPIFLIIVSVVKSQFLSLKTLSKKISEISSDKLNEFKNPEVPLELKPFLKSFNLLLKRLAASMEAERRFTDYAAHELNTPLTAIKLQAQILAGNDDKKLHKKYLDDLLKGIDYASHLVDQLLTLSRLEADSNNFIKEKFDLKNLAQILAQDIENINVFSRKNIDDFVIFANKTYIEILLINLLGNAVKYRLEGSEINFEFIDKSHFKISNLGHKIAPENIKNIFSNFYRVENSKSGSGLGLAISKKIVTLHGGSISLRCEDGLVILEVFLKS